MSCTAPALQQISRRLSAARTARGLFAETSNAHNAEMKTRVQVVRTKQSPRISRTLQSASARGARRRSISANLREADSFPYGVGVSSSVAANPVRVVRINNYREPFESADFIDGKLIASPPAPLGVSASKSREAAQPARPGCSCKLPAFFSTKFALPY